MSGSTSRLSSLLVRDGVVDVRRMEKAFQRQVLFEGALDTILLEMNELPEQRLSQYLSLATGLPPATARELDGLEVRAAERCPRGLAERFAVVPLSFDGDAMRVLARDPVDLGALEDLARELGAPVLPFVAPEFRYELAFDRVFGRTSDERFTRLAEASRLSIIPPVGGSPAVVLGAVPPPSASGPVASPRAVANAAAAVAMDAGTAAAPGEAALVEAVPDGSTAAHPTGRRTIEMTGDAIQRRRRETDEMAAGAYRRHAAEDEAALPLGPEATVPDAVVAEAAAAASPQLDREATPPEPDQASMLSVGQESTVPDAALPDTASAAADAASREAAAAASREAAAAASREAAAASSREAAAA
ncbi:MAG TPA: hypothetical protein VKB80_11425, partial [Kofleriaceae bacterium]|nr:hypothetical protein [Kofleriaceae bacterium]